MIVCVALTYLDQRETLSRVLKVLSLPYHFHIKENRSEAVTMPDGKLGKALRTARKKFETKTRDDEKKTRLAIEEQIAEFLETHGGLQLGQHHW